MWALGIKLGSPELEASTLTHSAILVYIGILLLLLLVCLFLYQPHKTMSDDRDKFLYQIGLTSDFKYKFGVLQVIFTFSTVIAYPVVPAACCVFTAPENNSSQNSAELYAPCFI